jgi:Fic family protein
MKTPQTPPCWNKLSSQLATLDGELLNFIIEQQPTYRNEYIHWDKLRRLDPPDNLTSEQWWLSIKLSRKRSRKEIALMCINEKPFGFLQPDPIPEFLHHIDQDAGGRIEMPEEGLTNPQARNRYLLHSLTEEAITSSQLEGATTTRKVAKEMLRENRPARDISEQMILNNYRTMQFIRECSQQPLSSELILKVHQTVTKETLENPEYSGRFRTNNNIRVYKNLSDEIVHTPPDFQQLPERMEAMCDFANGKTPGYFIHPVVRAIILHFWLAYDHPFVDGNGRCARALFYWSMLQQKYWLCEFISISQIIKKAPSKYGRAFLYTETDENDLTYFITYHLDIIQKAINELHKYIAEKTKSVQITESLLRQSTTKLNHRQISLLSHALRNPDAIYSIKVYQHTHNIVYETARADLLHLEDQNLLIKKRTGRSFSYLPAEKLDTKLKTTF